MSAIKLPASLGWHENTVIGKIEYPVLDADRKTICIAPTAKHGEAIHDALNKQAELQQEVERLREFAESVTNFVDELQDDCEAFTLTEAIASEVKKLQSREAGNVEQLLVKVTE